MFDTKNKPVRLSIIGLIFWGLVGLYNGGVSIEAQAPTPLSSLPFGSVIQIKGTDVNMCSNTACSSFNTNVLPYKFVKMQARSGTGATLGDSNGYNGYTYWALLDNYCWWGSAKCNTVTGTVGIADSAIGTAWNANSTSSYNNNLSDSSMARKITNQLSNFYNSLPAEIGEVAKEDAILNYAWEMRPVSNANPAVKSGCATNWASATITSGGNNFTFSNSSACTMTSRIGLLSYDEWQGGLPAYSSYATLGNLTGGAGGSYCAARYNASTGFPNANTITPCVNGSNYDLFNNNGTAANPWPYLPRFRSPRAGVATSVWYVNGSSAYSVNSYYASGSYGLLPSLWFSSSISTDGTGDGTYADPFNLSEASSTLTATFSTSGNITVNANSTLTIGGTVTSPNLGSASIVTVTGTINGINQQTQVPVGINVPWYLTWEVADDLGNTNQVGPFTFTFDDGEDLPLTMKYSGNIIVNNAIADQFFSVTNATQNQLAIKDSIIQIIGVVTDSTHSATIQAEIAGVGKDYTVSAGSYLEGWVLAWRADELPEGNYGGITTPITVSAYDSTHTLLDAADYTGIISVGIPEAVNNAGDTIALINQMINVRFAGTIYFPAGTTPNSDVKSADFSFSHHVNNNPDFQVWTKEIAGTNYPFLIRFFEPPAVHQGLVAIEGVTVN